MRLNLITDPWIPAVRGNRSITIRPDQIADAGVTWPDWPRADLNLACLELLIGLLFLADPPRDDGDWQERYATPDPERLRAVLEPFAPHFELTGDGPRFLQDLERFEVGAKKTSVNPPDMLFIDSAGESTRQKNADLMVKRDRYPALPLPLAAMALYTLQAFAPAGGSGIRTSMRGGGPMVTLVQPLDSGPYALWRLVWSNVPEGEPLPADRADEALPWLRETRTSPNDEVVTPEMSHPGEAFFGMPRRLRLLFREGALTGVVQKKHGTNYAHWPHPLSPQYCTKPGEQLLPVHPKPGKESYRNWLGLTFGQGNETRVSAGSVRRFHTLTNAPAAEVLAGGWAMSNAKPMDFGLHVYPTFRLGKSAELRARALVEAANSAWRSLNNALKKATGLDARAFEPVREAFFAGTESDFVDAVKAVADGGEREVEENWLSTLRRAALSLFDQQALPGLAYRPVVGTNAAARSTAHAGGRRRREVPSIEATVNARRILLAAFSKPTGVRKAFGLHDGGQEDLG